MASDPALEQTIDKILAKTEGEILADLGDSSSGSKRMLDDALPALEQEYDKIISDGDKEADKIEKQIIGSSDLEARNKELMALEDAVDRVFAKALDQVRSQDHSGLIRILLDESTGILGTSEVTVFANAGDRDAVKSELPRFPGAALSPKTIDCLGGVIVESRDGAMKFDNTIDARIERMKPLIRKEIASKFGVGG